MLEVNNLTEMEMLREIAFSRGLRAMPDSEFSGFKVISKVGILSYGHKNRLDALKDALSNEAGIDLGFIEAQANKPTIRVGDILQLDGKTLTVEEVFSRSGLIENPQTRLNLSQPGDNRLITKSFIEIQDAKRPSLAAERSDIPLADIPLADDTSIEKSLSNLSAKAGSRQFSLNF